MTLQDHGVEIRRKVFSDDQISAFISEADRVAESAGSACVRHLRGRSSLFDRLSCAEELKALVGEGLNPVRSILFDKTASENWPVGWHQDVTIALAEKVRADGYEPWSLKDGVHHVQPPSSLLSEMVVARIHLDETTSANGALRVILGSHLIGKIESGAVNESVGAGAEFVCECGPGDVVVMSPLVLHASRRSTVPSRRRVLHFEYACRDQLDPKLAWHEPETPRFENSEAGFGRLAGDVPSNGSSKSYGV